MSHRDPRENLALTLDGSRARVAGQCAQARHVDDRADDVGRAALLEARRVVGPREHANAAPAPARTPACMSDAVSPTAITAATDVTP